MKNMRKGFFDLDVGRDSNEAKDRVGSKRGFRNLFGALK